MIQKILYKFNEINLYRDFLSSNIFLFSKIKRLIKFLYKITCISFGKTIEIKKLVDKKEVIQKLVFHGEYYSLPEKLDINNRKFKYLPFGKYDIPDYSIYILDDGLIKAGTNCIFSKNGKTILGLNFQVMPYDFNVINNLKNLDIFYWAIILFMIRIDFIIEIANEILLKITKYKLV